MYDIINEFKKTGFTAIMRNIPEEKLTLFFSCLATAGVCNLEITLNSPSYRAAFNLLSTKFKNQFLVGAGTVLTPDDVDKAYELGAKFIVSPILDRSVIEKTKELGLLSISAALTPTEAVQAVRYGANIVKLFPAMHFPPAYVDAIKQPLDDIDFMLVGIQKENIATYKTIGIKYFGAGGVVLCPNGLPEESKKSELIEHISCYRKEVDR